MLTCEICHVQSDPSRTETTPPDPGQPNAKFAEMGCCQKALCNSCLPSALTAKLEGSIWYDLDEPDWVPCPVPRCEEGTSTTSPIRLRQVYESLGCPSAETHLKIFERAYFIRDRIREVIPAPSTEVSFTADRFHFRMHAWRLMDNIFFDLDSKEELTVELLSTMSEGGSIVLIPVITSLFKRETESKTCMICTEDLGDIEVQYTQAWKKSIRDFGGDLEWIARPFPTEEMLPVCSRTHPLDICRRCLTKHVDARLDVSNGAEDIRCPRPNCNRVYSDEEIKAIANQATFAKYDKARLLSVLAREPNFRWCLRAGCQSGQIYDVDPNESCNIFGNTGNIDRERRARGLPANADPNYIMCGSCGYGMCFGHQIPWHRGQTCNEYDLGRSRGDRDGDTEFWLAHNTKRCPGSGCGVPVEKSGGCFHMTCGNCGFEFCWECLADWSKIWTRKGYELEAHEPGCFFRDSAVTMPLFMTGDTVEEAAWVERRRRGGGRP